MSGDIWSLFLEEISPQFVDDTAHAYNCKCGECRRWWLMMGPEPETGEFGPFGNDLWDEYAERAGKSVAELKARYKNGLNDRENSLL